MMSAPAGDPAGGLGGGLAVLDAGPEHDRMTAITRDWLYSFGSRYTRRSYAADLGIHLDQPRPGKGPARSVLREGHGWFAWCAGRGQHPLAVATLDVLGWLDALRSTSLSVSTRAHMLAVVRSWYALLVDEGLLSRSPCATVRAKKQQLTVPNTTSTLALDVEQAAELLAAADQARGAQRLRVAAMVAVLLTTGVRVGELVGCELADLITRKDGRYLRVRGKGGKWREVPLPELAAVRVDAYLAARSDLGGLVPRGRRAADRRRPLFVTRTGSAVQTSEVGRLLLRLARAASWPAELVSRLTPHVTRHTTAALAQRAGKDLEDIRLLLGHAWLTTTQRYLHATGRSAADSVAEALAGAGAG